MMDREDQSDWAAVQGFRALQNDAERMEQLFLMALASARQAKSAAVLAASTDQKVGLQNGRISKLEVWRSGGAAVVAFLIVVIPILLIAASLLK